MGRVASIVIPAHNEGRVLGAVLRTLLADAEPGELDVVVVANGCTDDTADVARDAGPAVRLIETPVASKSNALNLGDGAALGFPRIYLDADIPISIDTVRCLAARLADEGALAATPTMRVDATGRPWSVRAYYDVWVRLPYVTDGQLAGVIALSQAGRSRFGEFPDVTADDMFVRGHFDPEERLRLEECEYVVEAPRTLRSLLRVKTRSFAGTIELGRRYPDIAERSRGRGGVRGRMRTMARTPSQWPALADYAAVWGLSRLGAWWTVRFRRGARWHRDETTRGDDGRSRVR